MDLIRKWRGNSAGDEMRLSPVRSMAAVTVAVDSESTPDQVPVNIGISFSRISVMINSFCVQLACFSRYLWIIIITYLVIYYFIKY